MNRERKPPFGGSLNLHRPRDPLTVVEAKIDVEQGNAVFIRGQGEGLSWEKGQPLNRGFGGSWIWASSKARGRLLFKLLLNDEVWSKGEDFAVEAGKMVLVAPAF